MLDYEPLEIIGKGSFGTVRKVRSKEDGTILVRKEIEYVLMNNHERNQIISELRILRELDHANIVKYWRHDHVAEKKAIHIYMEYCDGGDLGGLIKLFKKTGELVPEEFVWQVLVQTLLALHRCHYGYDAPKVNLWKQGIDHEPEINSDTVIIHRDIKPDNIFLLQLGKQVKVGDFGLAKMINTTKHEFAKTYVGTPYYMSPEVLMDNPYLPVCDIWLLGCVLFELCTLQPPFLANTHLQLQNKIKAGKIPEIDPTHYSPQLRQIIRECITVDPEYRPLCYDLLNNLGVRFLRKEMELKDLTKTLNEYQKQLVLKNDDLMRREQQFMTELQHIQHDLQKQLLLVEEKLMRKDALVTNLEAKLQDEIKRKHEQREEYEEQALALHKKFAVSRKQLEDQVDMKRRQMDMENKELRLNYQREFKMVVEQEVTVRLKEILLKNNPTPSAPKQVSLPRPKGPKELEDMRRLPLKTRNDEYLAYKLPLPRNSPIKKRVTDELERLSLEKRHTPEFESMLQRGR